MLMLLHSSPSSPGQRLVTEAEDSGPTPGSSSHWKSDNSRSKLLMPLRLLRLPRLLLREAQASSELPAWLTAKVLRDLVSGAAQW